MADQTNTDYYSSADILGQLNNDAMNRNTEGLEKNTRLLLQIHNDLDSLVRSGRTYSQGNMRDRMYDTRSDYRSSAGSAFKHSKSKFSGRSKELNDLDDILTEALNGFGEGIKDIFDQDDVFKDIKKQTQQDLKDIANAFNVQVKDLPKEFGKRFAKSILSSATLDPKYADKIGKDIQSYYKQMQQFANSLSGTKLGKYMPNFEQFGDTMREALQGSGSIEELLRNFKRGYAKYNQDIVHKFKEKVAPGASSAEQTAGEASDSEYAKKQSGVFSFADNTMSNRQDYIYPIYENTVSMTHSLLTIAQILGQSQGPQGEFNDLLDMNKDVANTSVGKGNGFISEMMGDIGGKGLKEIAGPVTEGIEGEAMAAIAGPVAEGAGTAGAALGGIGELAAGLAGPLAAIAPELLLAEVAIEALKWACGPAIDAMKEFGETVKKAGNRGFESWKNQIKTETERLTADVRTMIEAPFKIMEAAAQDWYNAWDNNLKVINQTQGYTKADLQALMASYSQNLREQGLTRVVSASDISNNLAQVLASGLSGDLAESFAYQATLLNNAIPTQNFFDYAETYASIAANAKVRGMSTQQAIQEADKQLQQFASNVLYASRELSGGFSTGLQNASSIFADAVKIANSAGVADSSYISGVLTAVASAVGAVAPDLAGGLVDAVVNAAVGGNSPEMTALRSLAGTGAANTAFLQTLAKNPQKVFANLFNNLAHMQRMSADNYMEVAEALSSVFGVQMDAFARVDFNYLANAISQMDVSNSSLMANIDLLKSGESTTTQEQLKMAEINEMILNEGLAYVLDNEAARMIQQHMWDQEIANEIKEAEYAIDFHGKSLELIEGISETVQRIMDLVNPIGWAIRTVTNVIATGIDLSARKADIQQMLSLGKVGVGKIESLHKLTTYNAALLKKEVSLVERMGGTSFSGITNKALSIFNSLTSVQGIGKLARIDTVATVVRDMGKAAQVLKSNSKSSASSMYNWNMVGKSLGHALAATPMSSKVYQANTAGGGVAGVSTGTHQEINDAKFMKFLNSMETATKVDFKDPSKTMSYEEWRGTASKYGIKDLDTELEERSISEAQLKGQYQSYQTQQASQYEWERENMENMFWEQSMEFYDQMLENMDELMNKILREEWMAQKWDSEWINDQWNGEWLENQWKGEWLDNAWQSNWLDTAWQQNWLDTAWQQNWLDNAWQTNWLDNAWQTNWLDTAWRQDFLDAEHGWNNFAQTYMEDWMGDTGRWSTFMGDLTGDRNWGNFYDTLINKWIGGSDTSHGWPEFMDKWIYEHNDDEYLNTIFGGAWNSTEGRGTLNALLSQVRESEGSDLALQLANSLSKSTGALKDALADPTVQTNVLLSQILIVLNQLMEAENTAGGATLATSLSGLTLLKS